MKRYNYITLQKEVLGDAFLSINDAAKLLNCSKRTIYRYIKSGLLKIINVKSSSGKGVRKLISYNSLINLLEKGGY